MKTVSLILILGLTLVFSSVNAFAVDRELVARLAQECAAVMNDHLQALQKGSEIVGVAVAKGQSRKVRVLRELLAETRDKMVGNYKLMLEDLASTKSPDRQLKVLWRCTN